MTESLWVLRLLGEFSLEHDGTRVDEFSDGKEDQVLALVALGGGRPVTRQEISALLWSDKPVHRQRVRNSTPARANRPSQARRSGEAFIASGKTMSAPAST